MVTEHESGAVLSWIRKHAFALVGVCVTTFVGVILEAKFGDSIRIWLGGPVTLMARPALVCLDGEVGRIIEHAQRAGDLRSSPGSEWQESAERAYLCESYKRTEDRAVAILADLAASFPGCFSYDEYATDNSGRVRGCFAIGDNSASICQAPIGKPAGFWAVTTGETRIFCLGNNAAKGEINRGPRNCGVSRFDEAHVAPPEIRTCTFEELKAIGLPEDKAHRAATAVPG